MEESELLMSRTIFIVHCECDDNASSPTTWDVPCATAELALKQAMHEIINWIDGMWDEYDEDDVHELVDYINSGRYQAALDLWEDMSSFSIEVDEEIIIEEIPDIEKIELDLDD